MNHTRHPCTLDSYANFHHICAHRNLLFSSQKLIVKKAIIPVYNEKLTFIVDLSIIIFVTLKKLINFLFTQFLAQCSQNMTQLSAVDSPIAFLIENAETLC